MENKAKKKSGFSLRRLIYNDKYLIIISLILAVVIWIVASINIGTDEAKTIKLNVPITLGDEISEQYGMQYYSLQDSIELNVTISGPKYVIGQVTDNDFDVNFDSSSVNRTGVQDIPILVTNNSKTLDFEITNTYPSTVEAFFDVNATQTFDVDVNYDADCIKNGYVFGKPILSENSVSVSGPKTYVDKIDSVYVDATFDSEEDVTEPFSGDCELQFKGLGLESKYISVTSANDTDNQLKNVSVTIPVLEKQLLPVVVDVSGAPKDVNNALSIRYSVDELNVGVLAGTNIKQAEVGKINYNQLDVGQNVFEFSVTDLKGITVLDDVEIVQVYVYVSSAYAKQTVDVSNVEVKVEGLAEGKKASVIGLDDSNLSIIAPRSAKITSENIDIVVDVSKSHKNNLYPAQITIGSNNNAWIFGKYNVEVKIN